MSIVAPPRVSKDGELERGRSMTSTTATSRSETHRSSDGTHHVSFGSDDGRTSEAELIVETPGSVLPHDPRRGSQSSVVSWHSLNDSIDDEERRHFLERDDASDGRRSRHSHDVSWGDRESSAGGPGSRALPVDGIRDRL